MYHEHNGIVSRWHQAARRGTLANVGWGYGALVALTYLLQLAIG